VARHVTVITLISDVGYRHYLAVLALFIKKRKEFFVNGQLHMFRMETLQVGAMKHIYDLFEKFRDGSTLWRESVLGLEAARVRLLEVAERSENRFYAINLTTGDILAFHSEHNAHGSRAPSKTEKRTKSQAA
jgi:hypothetical protein